MVILIDMEGDDMVDSGAAVTARVDPNLGILINAANQVSLNPNLISIDFICKFNNPSPRSASPLTINSPPVYSI